MYLCEICECMEIKTTKTKQRKIPCFDPKKSKMLFFPTVFELFSQHWSLMPNNLTKVLWTAILPIVLRLLKFIVSFCLSWDVCAHAFHWKPRYRLLGTLKARLCDLYWTVATSTNYRLVVYKIYPHFPLFSWVGSWKDEVLFLCDMLKCNAIEGLSSMDNVSIFPLFCLPAK